MPDSGHHQLLLKGGTEVLVNQTTDSINKRHVHALIFFI